MVRYRSMSPEGDAPAIEWLFTKDDVVSLAPGTQKRSPSFIVAHGQRYPVVGVETLESEDAAHYERELEGRTRSYEETRDERDGEARERSYEDARYERDREAPVRRYLVADSRDTTDASFEPSYVETWESDMDNENTLCVCNGLMLVARPERVVKDESRDTRYIGSRRDRQNSSFSQVRKYHQSVDREEPEFLLVERDPLPTDESFAEMGIEHEDIVPFHEGPGVELEGSLSYDMEEAYTSHSDQHTEIESFSPSYGINEIPTLESHCESGIEFEHFTNPSTSLSYYDSEIEYRDVTNPSMVSDASVLLQGQDTIKTAPPGTKSPGRKAKQKSALGKTMQLFNLRHTIRRSRGKGTTIPTTSFGKKSFQSDAIHSVELDRVDVDLQSGTSQDKDGPVTGMSSLEDLATCSTMETNGQEMDLETTVLLTKPSSVEGPAQNPSTTSSKDFDTNAEAMITPSEKEASTCKDAFIPENLSETVEISPEESDPATLAHMDSLKGPAIGGLSKSEDKEVDKPAIEYTHSHYANVSSASAALVHSSLNGLHGSDTQPDSNMRSRSESATPRNDSIQSANEEEPVEAEGTLVGKIPNVNVSATDIQPAEGTEMSSSVLVTGVEMDAETSLHQDKSSSKDANDVSQHVEPLPASAEAVVRSGTVEKPSSVLVTGVEMDAETSPRQDKSSSKDANDVSQHAEPLPASAEAVTRFSTVDVGKISEDSKNPEGLNPIDNTTSDEAQPTTCASLLSVCFEPDKNNDRSPLESASACNKLNLELFTDALEEGKVLFTNYAGPMENGQTSESVVANSSDQQRSTRGGLDEMEVAVGDFQESLQKQVLSMSKLIAESGEIAAVSRYVNELGIKVEETHGQESVIGEDFDGRKALVDCQESLQEQILSISKLIVESGEISAISKYLGELGAGTTEESCGEKAPADVLTNDGIGTKVNQGFIQVESEVASVESHSSTPRPLDETGSDKQGDSDVGLVETPNLVVETPASPIKPRVKGLKVVGRGLRKLKPGHSLRRRKHKSSTNTVISSDASEYVEVRRVPRNNEDPSDNLFANGIKSSGSQSMGTESKTVTPKPDDFEKDANTEWICGKEVEMAQDILDQLDVLLRASGCKPPGSIDGYEEALLNQYKGSVKDKQPTLVPLPDDHGTGAQNLSDANGKNETEYQDSYQEHMSLISENRSEISTRTQSRGSNLMKKSLRNLKPPRLRLRRRKQSKSMNGTAIYSESDLIEVQRTPSRTSPVTKDNASDLLPRMKSNEDVEESSVTSMEGVEMELEDTLLRNAVPSIKSIKYLEEPPVTKIEGVEMELEDTLLRNAVPSMNFIEGVEESPATKTEGVEMELEDSILRNTILTESNDKELPTNAESMQCSKPSSMLFEGIEIDVDGVVDGGKTAPSQAKEDLAEPKICDTKFCADDLFEHDPQALRVMSHPNITGDDNILRNEGLEESASIQKDSSEVMTQTASEDLSPSQAVVLSSSKHIESDDAMNRGEEAASLRNANEETSDETPYLISTNLVSSIASTSSKIASGIRCALLAMIAKQDKGETPKREDIECVLNDNEYSDLDEPLHVIHHIPNESIQMSTSLNANNESEEGRDNNECQESHPVILDESVSEAITASTDAADASQASRHVAPDELISCVDAASGGVDDVSHKPPQVVSDEPVSNAATASGDTADTCEQSREVLSDQPVSGIVTASADAADVKALDDGACLTSVPGDDKTVSSEKLKIVLPPLHPKLVRSATSPRTLSSKPTSFTRVTSMPVHVRKSPDECLSESKIDQQRLSAKSLFDESSIGESQSTIATTVSSESESEMPSATTEDEIEKGRLAPKVTLPPHLSARA